MFLIAVAAVLAAAGYFGWNKMHPVSDQPAVKQRFAPVEAPAAPAAMPQAASPNQQAAAPSTTPSQSVPSETSDLRAQEAEGVAAAPSAKTPSAKPSAAIPAPASTAKTAPAAKTQEPIVVKSDLSKKSNAQAAGEEPTQPPAADVFGLASNADNKAISGIVSATTVNVPKSAQTLKISQGMSQGMLLKQVQPIYPRQAVQMRIQGPVQLQASIGKDGSITNVKQLSGDAILGRAAMDAVQQWKYKPYYLNGEPVAVQTQVTVNFKLP